MTGPDLRTDLLVIGAGPYAYSAAAYAQERGIDTGRSSATCPTSTA